MLTYVTILIVSVMENYLLHAFDQTVVELDYQTPIESDQCLCDPGYPSGDWNILDNFTILIVINKTGYMYIKTLAAQQGCKTLTVACLKHKGFFNTKKAYSSPMWLIPMNNFTE